MICPYCNKREIKNKGKTCGDKECINKARKKSTLNTLHKKYGENVNCSWQNPKTKKSIEETKLERYGDKHYNNKEKTKLTVSNKTIEDKLDVLNKRRNTCISKYGVDNVSKNDSIKEKLSEKMAEIYEQNKTSILNKRKNTCIERYNSYSYQSTIGFKEYMSYMISSYDCLSKRKETNFKRYFNISYNNMQKHINTSLEKYNTPYYNNPSKRFATMKVNKSYSVSKEELALYKNLKNIYPDIIHQYRSENYQFNCDFYIPSYDLYIEYNGTWTHGGHPYNKFDDNDQKKLGEWVEKAKTSKYYYNAIYTWTDLDVRKRKMALENNLNYLEIWNTDDFKSILFKISITIEQINERKFRDNCSNI